jgi:2-aminoadipate transaminase
MVATLRPSPALSRRAHAVPSSAIRELLDVVGRRDVISLAGGLPDGSVLPSAALTGELSRVLATPGALQYGPTQGDPALRAWIAQHELGGADPDRVVVTHGAQQALQLLVDALVDPGDDVVVERASYVGMLQPLRSAGATLHPVRGDAQGVSPLELSELLGAGLRPKLVYLAPTYQNPTGSLLSDVRRRQLGLLARAHGVVLVDDDPYRRLGFDGAAPPRLRAHVPEELAVTVGSFSKFVAPGLRVGWLHGPRWLVQAVVRLKQAADLHTGSLDQGAVMALLTRDGWLEQHVATLRPRLHARAAVLVEEVERRLGDVVRIDVPRGGMFAWARVHESVGHTDELARTALANGVAFVPGSAFDPAGRPSNGARLCFATLAPDQLRAAVARLDAAVREQLRASASRPVGAVASSMTA